MRKDVHESKSIPRKGEVRQHHGIYGARIALGVDYACLVHLKSLDHLRRVVRATV